MEVDFSAEEEQELRLAAEKAKKNLTGKTSTAVAVNAAGERRRIEVTRAIFDELTSVERDRTFDITDRAIASARAKGVEVDEILLVGGSTLMPQIKEAIVAKYGIEPRSHDPSEAVAKGAALYAAWYYIEMRKKIKCGICGRALSECSCDPNAPAEKGVDSAEQQEAEKYRTELNVDTLLLSGGSRPRKTITATTKSYGIAVQDPTDHSRERIKNLILKNTSMPDDVFEAPGDFGTASENQSAVSIRIFESDQETTELFDLDPDYYLGEAELALPPGLPLGSPLIVTLSLDRQGRLHVHGQDVSSGREVHADMQIKGALSEAQVKELEDKTRNLIIKDY